MTAGGQEMLKIGEVAKICNVSIKTLRFYEEIGIVSPTKVDQWTGYRYYDETSIEKILQVLYLKDLGFSLQEIRDLDAQSLARKTTQIEQEIATLKQKMHSISVLSKQKGEIIMKSFVNDSEAIGKWAYVGSALSKDAYKSGDFVEYKDIMYKELYFLENGQGYWAFERWTKGLLFVYNGSVYSYEIENGKLFLTQIKAGDGDPKTGEYVLVYEKVSNRSFSAKDIEHHDNINLPFKNNEKMLGKWELVDTVDFNKKDNYIPNDNGNKNARYKEITLNPNGQAIVKLDNGNFAEHKWTDGKIINVYQELVCDATLTPDDNYLIMDWKSGDYVYAEIISCAFVFKKVK